jgi:TRAP-type C4-dicarboxylate transport system substrate-binding protein
VQAAELAQAMTTGVVNANITSGATGYDTKAWEHVKYYYDTQAWLPKNLVFVSQKAFDALDKTIAGGGAQGRRRRRGARLEGPRGEDPGTPSSSTKNGMTVAPPASASAVGLRKIGDTMTADWIKSAGADGKAIVDDVSGSTGAQASRPSLRRRGLPARRFSFSASSR